MAWITHPGAANPLRMLSRWSRGNPLIRAVERAGADISGQGAQFHNHQLSVATLCSRGGLFGRHRLHRGSSRVVAVPRGFGLHQLFGAHTTLPALVCGVMALGSALVTVLPAAAGPVLCTTSLEAPIVDSREVAGASSLSQAPVEVTRCGVVQTPPELLERRAYSWTAPFARGVDMTHQVTDLLGIAMGGGDGTKVMGFGFGDQTLIWDGSAIENTTRVLLEDQSNPMPLRTTDLIGVYNSSLGEAVVPQTANLSQDSSADRSASVQRSVRGLW